jgi:hypothetical protein
MSRIYIIFGTLGTDCNKYLDTHVESNNNNLLKSIDKCSAILIHYLDPSGADIFVECACLRKFRANYECYHGISNFNTSVKILDCNNLLQYLEMGIKLAMSYFSAFLSSWFGDCIRNSKSFQNFCLG